ncbi:hypothetical protein [Streptococcus sp. DD12]|uniref:hypothetical protein n=1 Tax=Streptococcus sp. DD12 TaxID=1777880 RepID=UPI000793AD5F|nr:hypothetical protein [Streptococcus sp. DD12]KXT76603.1 hypothetical protein STRDD12_00483 [Streptococcus sp. DD12]
MAKKLNRKKQLRNQIRRHENLASTVVSTPRSTGVGQAPAAQTRPQTFSKGENTKPRTAVNEDLAQKAHTLEAFKALPQVADIRSNLVETLYQAGLTSAHAFENWTEKEILALKGIGKATVDKLKANGVTFKAD